MTSYWETMDALHEVDSDPNTLVVFPNPSDGYFSITTDVIRTLKVFSVDGKEIFRQKVQNHVVSVVSLDLENHVERGTYLVVLVDSDQYMVRTRRIVIID